MHVFKQNLLLNMKYLYFFILNFLVFSSGIFSSEYKHILFLEQPEHNYQLSRKAESYEVKDLEELATKVVPHGVKWSIVSAADLPDGKWWPAWRISGSKVIVQMDIARELHMAKIRLMRNCMLEDLDRKVLRALENDDRKEKNKIVQQKKMLRSLPERIDLSKFETAEELSGFIPEEVFPIYDEFKEIIDRMTCTEDILKRWKDDRFRVPIYDMF